jgi:hypothetical protein
MPSTMTVPCCDRASYLQLRSTPPGPIPGTLSDVVKEVQQRLSNRVAAAWLRPCNSSRERWPQLCQAR